MTVSVEIQDQIKYWDVKWEQKIAHAQPQLFYNKKPLSDSFLRMMCRGYTVSELRRGTVGLTRGQSENRNILIKRRAEFRHLIYCGMDLIAIWQHFIKENIFQYRLINDNLFKHTNIYYSIQLIVCLRFWLVVHTGKSYHEIKNLIELNTMKSFNNLIEHDSSFKLDPTMVKALQTLAID